jgi:ABC-type sugar transport system ATPase subunit
MTASLLAAAGVMVRYGATTALEAVAFDARPGEVHALVGENGAGKSTLLRVLAGALKPLAGAMRRPPAVQVEWVPQEADLPADLTASEWIFLAAELRGRGGWLRRREMDAVAGRMLERVGCRAGARQRLGALAAAQRKQVQLARALRAGARVLLLDEPTAVLGARETERLFELVRATARDGGAVVYVSHRLDEVLALADRVTVLRDGRQIATAEVGTIDTQWLVERMVGRAMAPPTERVRRRGAVRLRVRGLTAGTLRDVSFAVHAGEIVGLAGLVGAGRSALLEALAGHRPRSGRVEADAAPLLVPEDRGRNGLVPTLSLRENLYLPADRWRLDLHAERAGTRSWVDALAIRAAGIEAGIDTLSGGNQQKLLLARALRHRPPLLLLDEPTAGVDVGAKAEIHATIERLAADGTAILLASSDLPELLALCDRTLALYRGALVGELSRGEATEPRLAALITGVEGKGTPVSRPPSPVDP